MEEIRQLRQIWWLQFDFESDNIDHIQIIQNDHSALLNEWALLDSFCQNTWTQDNQKERETMVLE